MDFYALATKLITTLLNGASIAPFSVSFLLEGFFLGTAIGGTLIVYLIATMFEKRVTHEIVKNVIARIGLPLILLINLYLWQWHLGLYGHSTLSLNIGVVITGIFLAIRIVEFAPISQGWQYLIIGVVSLFLILKDNAALAPVLNILDSIRIPLSDGYISLLNILQTVAIFSVLVWVVLVFAGWLEIRLESKKMSPTLRALLVKTVKIFLLVFAVLTTLNLMGINLASLTILGGALGIGIGFGLKTITSNFISGILLLMDHSIKPGDVISIDDQTFGQVKAMNTRYVVMRRRDGREVLVPNEQLITNQVINWSFSNRAVRDQIEIGVSYNSDMEQVQAILKEAAQSVPRVLEVPSPVVFIKEFADSSVVFLVRYWSNDPEGGVSNLRGTVNMSIWKALQANNIEIPFPQRVVHMADKS